MSAKVHGMDTAIADAMKLFAEMPAPSLYRTGEPSQENNWMADGPWACTANRLDGYLPTEDRDMVSAISGEWSKWKSRT